MSTHRTAILIGAILLLLVTPMDSRAQADARAIFDELIESLGGSAYLDAAEVRSTGRLFQFQRGELSGIEVFTDYLRFPDQERTEFGDDGDLIRINNGQEGWNIIDGKVEAQLPEQIEVFWEEMKVSLDYVLRVAIEAPETSLQHIGRDFINFRRVDILEIRDADRTRIDLYVDREAGLLVKKTVRRLNDPRVHEEVYSNYHRLQGVLTPLLIHRFTDGVKTAEIHFNSVVYNERTPDDLFRPDEER